MDNNSEMDKTTERLILLCALMVAFSADLAAVAYFIQAIRWW
ncbi:hypothetical protein ACFDWR_005060 [Salmonella enterica]|nr:hypothetical protein [Salmonella enterica]